jgi:pimeloyl-ACP methyl ester carboxylesterase
MFTFLDAAGYRTHYQTAGKAGKAPPILVIHGLMSTLNLWHYVRVPLSEHYQVLAYDLLECGLSEKKGSIPNGEALPQMVQQLKDLLDSFGWQQAVLFGASLGGAVALSFASQYPERVHSLVLAAPACYPMPFPGGTKWLAMPGLGEGLTLCAPLIPHNLYARAVLQSNYHRDTPLREAEIQLFLEGLDPDRRAMFAGGKAILRSIRWPPAEELAVMYQKIRIPTLILWGEGDRVIAPAFGRRLEKNMPQAVLKTLPGAGHLSFLEKPRDFLVLTYSFLEDQFQCPGLL